MCGCELHGVGCIFVLIMVGAAAAAAKTMRHEWAAVRYASLSNGKRESNAHASSMYALCCSTRLAVFLRGEQRFQRAVAVFMRSTDYAGV